MSKNWICNHLGARAHYEIPKALQLSGSLKYLLTDFWLYNKSLQKPLSFIGLEKLFQRHSRSIPNEVVKSFNIRSLVFEFKLRFRKIEGWELIIMRNNWYQKQIVAQLKNNPMDRNDIFFSFAYTGLLPIQTIKEKGLRTILYQMDPGVYEEELVKKEYEILKLRDTNWQPAPKNYWDTWFEECSLYDKILVNSTWSANALKLAGIDSKKIRILPLPYTIPNDANHFQRTYPVEYTKERPLRVLFLGTLTVRKGFHRVLKVAENIKNEPVEFIFVGQKEFDFAVAENIKHFPHVSREETCEFYKNADVFLFPTLSDGFGLTQLEALSWKLPVISSQFCGDVVEDNQNGIILKENTVDEIVELLIKLKSDPSILDTLSLNCFDRVKQFNHESFAKRLLTLAE